MFRGIRHDAFEWANAHLVISIHFNSYQPTVDAVHIDNVADADHKHEFVPRLEVDLSKIQEVRRDV